MSAEPVFVNNADVPEHGWTCFHCGETFTLVSAARDHFGSSPEAQPGCMIKVALGEERGLLMALRKTEAELYLANNELHNESSMYRNFHAMLQTSIQSFGAFRKCRTLQDVFNLYDSMEGRALAAEERLPLEAGESHGKD